MPPPSGSGLTLAQLGVALDDYAQLHRCAKEAPALEGNIRVHRCTQLAHSTFDRPVLDPQVERVPEDWHGVRLGARNTCFPGPF